jgi:hypothetical protein
MSYTLGEAARAAGKSKPTIARAIKRGLISATKAADGSYEIDPSELSRVFQLSGNGAGTMKQSVTDERDGVSLVQLLAERDRLVVEQAETIRDLRARLDREAEERRQLIAILTDQRRRPWWRRWFR